MEENNNYEHSNVQVSEQDLLKDSSDKSLPVQYNAADKESDNNNSKDNDNVDNNNDNDDFPRFRRTFWRKIRIFPI